jgi:hypothetical protein
MAMLAIHHHHSGPNHRTVVWDLWLIELCGKDFPPSTPMSPVSIFLPVLHSLVVIFCRHYINLATDSIID